MPRPISSFLGLRGWPCIFYFVPLVDWYGKGCCNQLTLERVFYMKYSIFHPKVNQVILNEVGLSKEVSLDNHILNLRPKIEQGKEYSYLAACVLNEKLRLECLETLGISNPNSSPESTSEFSVPQLGPESEKHYPHLRQYVHFGIQREQLSPELATFDLEFLNGCLDQNRNYLFDYIGAHTLYDRYLLHKEGKRYESLQHLWMRIAMGVALAETSQRNEAAAQFYHLISQMLYVPSTPTLFNSGTQRSQMSSCFLTTTQDDLMDIFRQYTDNALLSKYAGGLGNDWTNIRGSGSWIKGTNGRSQGVIPFLKVQDSSTIAVNQGGKRKGAVCAYLETWHIDLEDFLELRKNTGDERRRTPDMFTANWIPDLFMERVCEESHWTLFCPSEVPHLHDLYGDSFKVAYLKAEAQAQAGILKNFKTVNAVTLWRKMLSMLFETGHPWITFKDPCNLRSPQSHVGVVHSSNLCTEITLNTSPSETAVCNLGSLNLKNIFLSPNPYETLKSSIKTAMRMLDNVITKNFYPIESAKRANELHRPVGLGVMGLQDVFYLKKVPFSSPEAVYLNYEIMRSISYFAVEASAQLGIERGSYESFAGSTWSQGLLPQDTFSRLGSHVIPPEIPREYTNAKGEVVSCQDLLKSDGFGAHLDLDGLRSQIKLAMRNSLCMAIAPTATISNIAGCVSSIEPSYKNLYVKSNLGGEYTIINEYLVDDLRQLGLWSQSMAQELKRQDGSVEMLPIPDSLKKIYATAFDIEPEQMIRLAAVRQLFIDQSQSLNLFIQQPSGKKLDQMYKTAWKAGLKTTYYLRSKAATSVEKSSVKLSSISPVAPAQACSIENPDCESCQ